MVINVYLPAWFKFKLDDRFEQGSINFFYLLQLTNELNNKEKKIAHKVLQDNCFWSHPENILVSMIADKREDVRHKAVLLIKEARDKTMENQSEEPRKFVLPMLDFNADDYFKMVPLDDISLHDPPLLSDIPMDEILKGIERPISLDYFPNHNQSIERMVKVVSECATQKVGFTGRHRHFLQKLASHKIVSSFNTKSDDVNLL